MRDFSWQYFRMTGDVDAYLLYKQIENKDLLSDIDDEPQQESQQEEGNSE